MRDEDHAAAFGERVDGKVHELLAPGVEVGGRLVQEEKPWRAEEEPGEGHSLGLAGRESAAALADEAVQPAWQGVGELVDPGEARRPGRCRRPGPRAVPRPML